MSFVLLIAVILSVIAIAVAQPKTVITTTYVPTDCTAKSKNGDFISVHYTGSIDESSESGHRGEVFDSSVTRNQAFGFTLGAGRVIPGWEEGLVDMCPGEKRVLTIPPNKAYGDRGAGGKIPGGATLKFEVEMISISETGGEEAEPEEPNVFAEMDTNGDGLVNVDEFQEWFQANEHPQWEEAPNYFPMEDKDGSGSITWDEFGGPKGTERIANNEVRSSESDAAEGSDAGFDEF